MLEFQVSLTRESIAFELRRLADIVESGEVSVKLQAEYDPLFITMQSLSAPPRRIGDKYKTTLTLEIEPLDKGF